MEYLTIEETAYVFGIDRSTAYLKVKRGQIPAVPLRFKGPRYPRFGVPKEWVGQQIGSGKVIAPDLLSVLPKFIEALTGLSWGSIYTVLFLWANGCAPYVARDGRIKVIGPPNQAKLVAFYEDVLNRPRVVADVIRTLQAISERFPSYRLLVRLQGLALYSE